MNPCAKGGFADFKMSCTSCVNRVQRALNWVPGVLVAGINFAAKKAALVHIPGAVTIKVLVAASAA